MTLTRVMMTLTMTLMMTSMIVTLFARGISFLDLRRRSLYTFVVIIITGSQLICSRGPRLRGYRVLAASIRTPMPGSKVRLISTRVQLWPDDALLSVYRELMPTIQVLMWVARLQLIRSRVMLSMSRALMPVT